MTKDQIVILLLNRYPFGAKISTTVVSSILHPIFILERSFSFCNNDQNCVQCVPLKITCIYEGTRTLSKTISFRNNQIAQQIELALTKINDLSFLCTP